MTTGIYKLNFSNTSKVYVGQSIHIEKRYKEHIQTLKDGTASKKLLAAFKEYGEPSLEILCVCSKNDLNALENEAIEIYDAYNNGFNSFSKEGGSVRALVGLAHPGSKYSKITILKVFSLLYRTTIPYSTIAKKIGIKQYLVNNIVSGSHIWLKYEYPKQYEAMLYNRSVRNSTNLKTISNVDKYTNFVLVSPTGVVHNNITSIAEFCRNQPDLCINYDSSRSAIGKVLKGTKSAHLGWTKG